MTSTARAYASARSSHAVPSARAIARTSGRTYRSVISPPPAGPAPRRTLAPPFAAVGDVSHTTAATPRRAAGGSVPPRPGRRPEPPRRLARADLPVLRRLPGARDGAHRVRAGPGLRRAGREPGLRRPAARAPPVGRPAAFPVARPVAVVTGAARGIGLETARRLHATHRVALLDIDGQGAERAAVRLRGDAVAAACDITDGAAVVGAVADVVERCGGVDVAIANAGIATAGALRHLDPDVLALQLDVNLVGSWRFIHACLPHVIARRGYVLGVSSASAIVAPPGLGASPERAGGGAPRGGAGACCSRHPAAPAAGARPPRGGGGRLFFFLFHRHRHG